MKLYTIFPICVAFLHATNGSSELEYSTNLKRLRSHKHDDWQSKNSCDLFWKFEQSEDGDVETLECEMKLNCGKIRRLELEGISEEWMVKHKREIRSARTSLVAPNLVVTDDYTIQVDDPSSDNSNTYIVSKEHTVVEQHHDTAKSHQRNLSQRSKGIKQAIVLHITTEDGSKTAYTPEQLSERFFGQTDNDMSLRSQMNSCSYGQLDIEPSTKKGIVGGVYSINVDVAAQSSDKNGRKILNAALDKLREDFTEELSDSFDHIMVCIPKGVKPFTAYAWMNDYLSVYYDHWCDSISAKMHEVGHNMGLEHSGRGTCEGCESLDFSGYMGHVYNRNDFPKMCYNAPKSWELGWYAPKAVTINPLEGSWSGTLVGIADYYNIPSTSASKVILELAAPGDSLKHYIIFNRRTGMNSETQQGGNRVLVTNRDEDGLSVQEAKLGIGKEYIIQNFGNKKDSVTIKFDSIDKESPAWSVAITVTGPEAKKSTTSVTPLPTSPPTHPPSTRPQTRPPTRSPTSKPTRNPTLRPTNKPTRSPTLRPTNKPTSSPTRAPTLPQTPRSSGDGPFIRTESNGAQSINRSTNFCYSYNGMESRCKKKAECVWIVSMGRCEDVGSLNEQNRKRRHSGREISSDEEENREYSFD